MRKNNFRSLEINAKTLINSFGTGSHVSCFKDSIIDVDVVREYQPGDKKLDSKSSLKTSKTMARVFTPDKSMTIFPVLDVSASQSTKKIQSFTICLYLAYLAELVGDSVGVMMFNDRILDLVIPSQDARNVVSVLENNYCKDFCGKTDMGMALKTIASLELTNSMIVIISDFCYDLSDMIVSNLRRIAGGINNVIVSLVMINEKEWQFDNMPFSIDLSDAESHELINWNFKASSNQAYCQYFHEWQSKLKVKLRQAKTEPIFLNVDRNDYIMPLVKYFLRSK